MQQINGGFFYELGQLFRFRRSKQAKDNFYDTRVQMEIATGQVRMSTDIPYDLYHLIPEIGAPIDKIAAMFSNGVFKFQPTGSTELHDLPKDLAELLENPNMLTSQNAFMELYMKQLLVYGNQFIYKNQPSRITVPKSLMNISSAYITPVLTGKIFDQVDMSGVVEKFEYSENGLVRIFDTDSILWTRLPDLDNPLIGTSPLMSLKFPISNTELAYKYLNVISGEKGAIGILSNQSKDNFGGIPLTPEEKKKVELAYRQQNGIEQDQKKIIITNSSLAWSPMSYPTKELILPEQIDANFKMILNKFGVNMYVFIDSTYENLKHGLVSTHNDAVAPKADAFTQSLTKFIGLKGGRLVLDYSHLPYLQKDKTTEATTFSTVSQALSTLVSAGIITSEKANKIRQAQFPDAA